MPPSLYPFTLPFGYQDANGTLHRDGLMRLATALDEVQCLSDPRVQQHEAYLGLLLLSRVVVSFGTVQSVGMAQIEQLYAADYVYLQALYLRLNSYGEDLIETECPACQTRFILDNHPAHQEVPHE